MSGRAMCEKRGRENAPRVGWRGPRSVRLGRVTRFVGQASASAAQAAPRRGTLAEPRVRRRTAR